jgi:hypothetical protein
MRVLLIGTNFGFIVWSTVMLRQRSSGLVVISAQERSLRVLTYRLIFYPVFETLDRIAGFYYQYMYGWELTPNDSFSTNRYVALYVYVITNSMQSISCLVIFLIMQPRALELFMTSFPILSRYLCCFCKADGDAEGTIGSSGRRKGSRSRANTGNNSRTNTTNTTNTTTTSISDPSHYDRSSGTWGSIEIDYTSDDIIYGNLMMHIGGGQGSSNGSSPSPASSTRHSFGGVDLTRFQKRESRFGEGGEERSSNSSSASSLSDITTPNANGHPRRPSSLPPAAGRGSGDGSNAFGGSSGTGRDRNSTVSNISNSSDLSMDSSLEMTLSPLQAAAAANTAANASTTPDSRDGEDRRPFDADHVVV